MAEVVQDRGEQELLRELERLLLACRPAFRQQRVFQRAVLLLVGEVLTFARHTVSQILMALGWVDRDWGAWYRLFRGERFPYMRLVRQLLEEMLEEVEGGLMVVAGDGTTTRRSSGKMEGVGWLPHPETAPFAKGLALGQRWFHLAWLTPAEGGYSRAVPLLWMPAFTPKSHRKKEPARSEVKAALVGLRWLRMGMKAMGRQKVRVLMVGDGRYDHVAMWRRIPSGVILLARTARNRRLYFLPKAGMRANRKYGERAPKPEEVWQERKGWRELRLEVRGRERHLQVKVVGPVVRYGVAEQPLFLLVVRGKHNRRVRREPLAFLVNGVPNEAGGWELPLPVEKLLFWAWQRWEIEVAHRELKSAFGLGEKQCWHPEAAVRSVQWSAWVYAMLLLAGYRAWGLRGGPRPPSRWWRGGGRWSLNTLWRAYRAAWWGEPKFRPVDLERVLTAGDLSWLGPPMDNAAFGAARL